MSIRYSNRLRRPAVLLGLLLSFTGPAAQAINTAAREVERYERTDHVSVGVGGIGAAAADGGGVGTLTLAGVSGTVTRAWLYWEGIDIESPPQYTGGNYDYDEADIVFDGQPLTGARAMGGGHNNCWGGDGDEELPPEQDHSAALYRADVTAQVIAKGNGDYALAGLADGAGHSANGASLIVFYNDADTANDRKVVLYESMTSNSDPEFGPALTLPIDHNGGNAIVELHVADGQTIHSDGPMYFYITPGVPPSSNDTLLDFYSIDGVARWAGQTVPRMGFPRSGENELWDIRQFDIGASLGGPKHYDAEVALGDNSDCVAAVVELVSVPADPQPTLITPNPHDFGDVVIGTASPAQRFTLLNNQTRPLAITSNASTGSTRHTILADSCLGQTLDPGQSCTVDVDCRPSGFAEYETNALKLSYQIVGATGTSNTAYAELLCSGVPGDAFARLSFTEPALRQGADPIDFGSVPEGSGETLTRRFVLTSTGTAPVTVGDVDASNAGTGTNKYFVLGAETCTGRVLAPGQTCTVDAVFAPNPANSAPGVALVGTVFADWIDAGSGMRGVVSQELTGSVTEVAGPNLYLDPLVRDYGEAQVGEQTGTYTFTARNFGDTPLAIATTLAGANPDDFVFLANDCAGITLAANATCAMNIRFRPQAAGSRTAQLLVSGTTGGGVTVNAPVSELSGTGVGSGGPALFVSDDRASESEAGLTFVVGLNPAASGPVTVNYATQDGSATAGTDYTAASGTLSFAAGETFKLVTVPLLGDTLDEPNETFTVTLSSPSGAEIIDANATLTIEDDDEPAPPGAGQIVFGTPGSYSVNESASVFQVPVVRIGGDVGAVSVTVTTANGSATAPGDYGAVSTVVNFAGGTSGTLYVDISVVNDTLDEADETVQLTLSNPTGGATLGDSSGTLTIIDDDETAPPEPAGSVQFSTADFGEFFESGDFFVVTIERNGGSNGAVIGAVITSNGTATAGADYTGGSYPFSFTDGDAASKTVQIPILEDALEEPAETVNLQLTLTAGSATLGAIDRAVIAIQANDTVFEPGTLQLSASSYAVDESGGTLTIRVSRTGGSDGAASVGYTTGDLTATAGADYATQIGTLTWADGDAADKTVTIEVLDDSAVEADETLSFALSSASGATLGTPASATLTIADNDEAPPAATGTLGFSAELYSAGEGAGSAMITVTRSGGSAGAASVRYATGDGSATAGSDYTAASGQLDWAAGDAAPKSFSVTLRQDAADEADETVSLTLSAAAGATLGSASNATLRITDDDTPPAPVQEGELTKGGGAMGGGVLLLGLLAALRRRRLMPRTLMLLAALGCAPALSAAEFYVGAQGGAISASLDSQSLTETLQSAGYDVAAELDDDDSGWGVYGGWYLQPRIALELAYRDLGEYSARVSGDLTDGQGLVEAAADGFPGGGDTLSAALRLDLPLYGRLSLRPSLGVFVWDTDIALQTADGRYETSSDGAGLLAGLGLDLRLGAGLSVGAGIDLLRPGHEGAQQALYGRLEWRFGKTEEP